MSDVLSQDATFEIQNPAPTAHKKGSKEKEREFDVELSGRNSMFREQRISLVYKQGDDNNLNYFSFLFVCVKTTASHEQAILEVTVANLVTNETSALQKN